MHREAHYWYSNRLERELGVVIYGHYGPPMLAFPTTGGDEWEYERQGVIGAMAGAIDAGRVKVFCVNTNNGDSFGNDRAASAAPQLDAGPIRSIYRPRGPAVRPQPLRSHDVGMWAMGASLGGYHAGQHAPESIPTVVKRCFALSGVVRHEALHGRRLRRQLLFQQSRRLLREPHRRLGAPSSRELRHPPGHRTGPWEHPEEAYDCRGFSRPAGIGHHLDDWVIREATTGRTGVTRCMNT